MTSPSAHRAVPSNQPPRPAVDTVALPCRHPLELEDEMRRAELAPFYDVPFYFWAKDADGRYVWGNRAMAEFAGRDVAGCTDAELEGGAESAATVALLRLHDEQVLPDGGPLYVHEPIEGAGRLSVCKWAGELDGEPVAFGVSFHVADD